MKVINRDANTQVIYVMVEDVVDSELIRTGSLETTHTARGLPRFALEIWHDGVNQYQVIKGDNPYVVVQKAEAKLAMWEEQFAKKKLRADKQAAIEDAKSLAEERTLEAQEDITELEQILTQTLDIDDSIDWDALKDRSKFSVPRPERSIPPAPTPVAIKPEPKRSESRYQVEIGFLDKIFASRRRAKEEAASERYRHDHARWVQEKESIVSRWEAEVSAHEERVRQIDQQHKEELAEWEHQRDEYIAEQRKLHEAIDTKKAQYLDKDPEAVKEYCDLVLTNSDYPDYFPQSFDLDFVAETGILIVDYLLPKKESLPTLNEVGYIQSKGEFKEKHISDSQVNKLYDSAVYQIALRTVHELFEADRADSLAAVVFNGYVDSIDPATGQAGKPCILSVQARKDEFLAINLAAVDPKACFKSLKGIGSSKLHSLTPVAPIMWIDRDDKRFVGSYDVANTLDEGYNLATMDWEDFEHLVRELFEKEFSNAGGEVRVTQASRDGGIDAVVFDPDPIRGGKIVIQAKRYTNTVGVSAVRDLYGTVLNEGANKGVLVTTSDFGPDAYSFANGKPLALVSGSNLLHLLEKHGHKARIDLVEARKLASDK